MGLLVKVQSLSSKKTLHPASMVDLLPVLLQIAKLERQLQAEKMQHADELQVCSARRAQIM